MIVRRSASRFAVLAVLVSLIAPPTCVSAQTEPSSAAKLEAFYAAEWEYQLSHSPEFATYTGDTRFNDRLGDYTAAGQESGAKHDQEAIAALQAIAVTGLTEQQMISRDMMLRQLQMSVDSYLAKEWEMPVSQMNGVPLDLPAMYEQMPFHDSRDYRNYIARLHQVPRVFAEVTAVMRIGMKDHLMQPRYLLEKVAVEAQDIALAHGEKSSFAEPLTHFPSSVTPAEQQTLRRELRAAIEQEVLPAYVKFAAFVRDTYAPAGRTEPGIWSLPNGDALYKQAIREHVQTTMDADAIFNEGVREVNAIEVEMLTLAKSQGFHDLASFHAHIGADPELHAVSGDQLLKLYAGYEAQSRTRLDTILPVVPTLRLEIVPMDSFRAPNAVPADYSPGSTASQRPGRVNVNLYKPASRLLLNVEAIAYHEGVPGHHLQFSVADTLHDLPPFRRYASYDAYSEGWALYAELLGKEMGFYQDPFSEYGRLQNEMWRAIRLVVDTGVHQKHWTRQQMVDFFKQHTAMDDQNIQTEVDRYISWPGQALSYRLGQQKILQLRERSRKELGPRFDVRQFHERVLSLGPVPLDLLDESITRWIQAQQTS